MANPVSEFQMKGRKAAGGAGFARRDRCPITSRSPASRSMSAGRIRRERKPCRGPASRPTVLDRPCRAGGASRAAQPETAGGPRDRCRPRSTTGTPANGPVAADPRRLRSLPAGRSAISCRSRPISPSRPTGLDPEISSICGPQLVVPVSNARYALNAANARWGSLYDALLRHRRDRPRRRPGARQGSTIRSAAPRCSERVAEFLDEAFPLAEGSHEDVDLLRWSAIGGRRAFRRRSRATSRPRSGTRAQFVGYHGEGDRAHILLQAPRPARRTGHRPDPPHRRAPTRPASPTCIVESALTTIQDCEDSVAAVDAEDKVGVYRNWLGLMNGTLEDTFEKDGKTSTACSTPTGASPIPTAGTSRSRAGRCCWCAMSGT